jgi:putative DNA primase/helicase
MLPFTASPCYSDRLLALISDARLSKRTEQGPIIETILSVSGEDPITVPRKFLPAWNGRLPVRFVMLSNELPEFLDIGSAFVSRWIILRFPNSFFGREDPNLTAELLSERAGILNWALAALDRLRQTGRFAQPRASADLLQRWEDLSSPIGAFLRMECVVNPDAEVEREELFDRWKAWRADQEMTGPGTKPAFGKALIANVPGLINARGKHDRDLAGRDLPRTRLYRGIRLKTARERSDDE